MYHQKHQTAATSRWSNKPPLPSHSSCLPSPNFPSHTSNLPSIWHQQLYIQLTQQTSIQHQQHLIHLTKGNFAFKLSINEDFIVLQKIMSRVFCCNKQPTSCYICIACTFWVTVAFAKERTLQISLILCLLCLYELPKAFYFLGIKCELNFSLECYYFLWNWNARCSHVVGLFKYTLCFFLFW